MLDGVADSLVGLVMFKRAKSLGGDDVELRSEEFLLPEGIPLSGS